MSWITAFDQSATSNLDFRVLLPCARLRPYVRYYWILKCHGRKPSTEEYLAPDGFEELIFSFEGSFRRTEIQGGSSDSQILNRSYVVGCKTVGVNCLRMDDLGMIGVKFWPNSLHSLLGMPMDGLRGRPVSLRDLGEPGLLEMESRLFDAPGDAAIKRMLDEFFTPAQLSRRASRLVTSSVARIFEARGDISIDHLLKSERRHYRTAERAFLERVGVSPKQLAKVIRFKHALTGLMEVSRRRHAIAGPMDFGYYDASHFAKDFRRFTGTTPTKLFRAQAKVSTEIFDFCLDVDINRLGSREAERGFAL
jgi:AraC-like DNA-binding protein